MVNLADSKHKMLSNGLQILQRGESLCRYLWVHGALHSVVGGMLALGRISHSQVHRTHNYDFVWKGIFFSCKSDWIEGVGMRAFCIIQLDSKGGNNCPYSGVGGKGSRLEEDPREDRG